MTIISHESPAHAVAAHRAEKSGLEPLAMHVETYYNADEGPDETEIELSKAISLKRIADALWGNDIHDGATTGIIQLLNGVEQNLRMRP